MDNFRVSFKSAATNACETFSSFFDGFVSSINNIKLNEKQTTEVFKQSKELAHKCVSLNNLLCENGEHSVNSTLKFIDSKMDNVCTAYKRQKEVNADPLYVAPKECAIGTRWEMVVDKKSGKRFRQSVQSTFQYVSIVDTLKSVFQDSEFKNNYLKFNNDHTCVPGVYERFCCSEVWKELGLSRNALLIEIFTDDFEICSVLKSKANLYKTCAVYFQIKNLPSEYLSKLSSIYLVALCNPDDIKQAYTSFNNILDLIVKEVKMLESSGIVLGDKTKLQGTVCNMAFDNLGGNTCLGFAESFSANFFCRICETPKCECQKLPDEIASNLRTRESYDQILSEIENKKFDLTMSKGIKLFCSLNKLKYFHITQNLSVNMDHDINEGLIPFALKKVFDHCIQNGLLSLNELENRISGFNYGHLNRKNIPSILCMDKKNLNQNASQSYCLMTHIPFILSHLKGDLTSVWPIITTLLQAMQIIYSRVIAEKDVQRLEVLVRRHLSLVMSTFKCTLIPKQHIFTHYPRVIRATGPPLNMWSMRYEGKHKYFTDLANKTNNFINIYKTLATRHQAMLLKTDNPYTDHVESSKIHKPFKGDSEKYKPIMTKKSIAVDDKSYLLKTLKLNGIEYKQGLLLKIGVIFYEIEYILCASENFYIMTSRSYNILKFEEFYNALVLECKDVSCNVFNTNELTKSEKQSYEKIILNGKIFVKSINLKLSL